MKFSRALPILFSEFAKHHIEHALVGGLALYTLGTSRSTFDADFMILLSQADDVDHIMKNAGYNLFARTSETAHYRSKDVELGQVDFLFAHRRYALAMLQRASKNVLIGLPVRVVLPEDLIGLKIQASSNDSARMEKDMADVQDIMQKHGKTLDWPMVKEYFCLFKRESEFKLLKKRFQ